MTKKHEKLPCSMQRVKKCDGQKDGSLKPPGPFYFKVEGIKIMYIQMRWLNYVLLGSTSYLQESVIKFSKYTVKSFLNTSHYKTDLNISRLCNSSQSVLQWNFYKGILGK